MADRKKSSGIVGGLAWTFAERITAQLVSTVVGIVLARILSPDHYGIIGIVMVFITLCNVFVASGFGTAIVQKKEADSGDYNTAFFMSFIMSVVLYTILFFASPAVADFYSMPELTPVLRVLGIRLFFASLNTIQHAYIQRTMQFRKFFVATLLGTILSGIVGVVMAVSGYGVWALVAQYLTNTSVDTLVLAIVGGWNPGWSFSRRKAKEILSFGWKVLCTDLVFTLENDIRSLVVGKVFGPADLAYYDQGRKYPSLLVTNVNSSIQKVLLPALSREQDDHAALKDTLRKCIKVGMYVLCPILVGFAAVSQGFVSVVLTDKWESAIPFMLIFCFAYLFRPIESACHQAILAIGKSGLVFWIMTAINAFSLLGVIVATFVIKSVLWIALFSLMSTLISITCFFIAVRKHIDYKLTEQLQDISPALLMSLLMGACIFFVGKLLPVSWLGLILQVVLGGAIYLAVSHLSKNQSYLYMKKMALSKLKKQR